MQVQSSDHYGTIELITGPMFSGKTTKLISEITKEQYSKKRCLLIKYSADLRYSTDSVCSHDMLTMAAKSVNLLFDLEEKDLESYEVIGIDEGQFFSDLVEFCEKYVRTGKKIVVAALDTDFKRRPWPVIEKLIPSCLKNKKMTARCYNCGKKAGWTQKKIQSGNSVDDKNIEIGGKELYVAVCLFHYDHFNIGFDEVKEIFIK